MQLWLYLYINTLMIWVYVLSLVQKA